MAWDDELDQLVTQVREALAEAAFTRAVQPARVIDLCGLAGPTGPALNTATALQPVDSFPPALPLTLLAPGARVFDLCGLGARP